jgi:mannose-6-phosphate isomerase-like protein (cupin superfamily)
MPSHTEPIRVIDKFKLVPEHWSPRIIAQVNDTQVKVVRLLGEFHWHHHVEEDELFWVISGRLLIQFRDGDVWLEPGELLVVPRGVEHRPVAPEEVHVVLIEPGTTLNTGNVSNERTVRHLESI